MKVKVKMNKKDFSNLSTDDQQIFFGKFDSCLDQLLIGEVLRFSETVPNPTNEVTPKAEKNKLKKLT